MRLARFLTAAAIIAAVPAGSAVAQQKNELAGTFGRTIISNKGVIGVSTFDPVVRSGKGLTFEATYARRFWQSDLLSLTFEVPVMVNPDEDIHFSVNLVPEDYSAFFVTPSARLNLFANQALSPWISVGGGFGHFSAASNLEFGGKSPGPSSSTTGVFQIGAGFDVQVWRQLGIRGEVRDFDSATPPVNVNLGKTRQHNLFVGAGVVWRF